MDVGSQNLTADEAVFRYEQQRADAEAKKNKEIAISMSREQNEAMRVASDEAKKTSLVQQGNEGEVGKAEQDKVRQIAIAEKAREREISIEVERNEKARSDRGDRPRAGGRAAAHREGEGAGDRAQGDRRGGA
jgi:hypothetical protein